MGHLYHGYVKQPDGNFHGSVNLVGDSSLNYFFPPLTFWSQLSYWKTDSWVVRHLLDVFTNL